MRPPAHSQQVEEVGFEQRHRQAHVLQNFEIWSVLRPFMLEPKKLEPFSISSTSSFFQP